MDLQAKLLRVLETREVRRVGQSDTVEVDFRLVAATNRDLAQEVENGNFRSDLYYRLDAMRIQLPALAERIDDIPALVDHFLRLEGAKSGVERRISPQVLERLAQRDWPGNVRELSNEVARLCVLSPADLIDPDLVREARQAGSESGISDGPAHHGRSGTARDPRRPRANRWRQARGGAPARDLAREDLPAAQGVARRLRFEPSFVRLRDRVHDLDGRESETPVPGSARGARVRGEGWHRS